MTINSRIELLYKGRLFSFDLADGDEQDYWNSFTYNGKEVDINYYPVLDALSIYNVHDKTGQIETSQFEPAYLIGDFSDCYIEIDLGRPCDDKRYFKRYADSNDIIIYDWWPGMNADAQNPFYPMALSNASADTLIEIFNQKIKSS